MGRTKKPPSKEKVFSELGKLAFAELSDGEVKASEKLKALELLGKGLMIFEGGDSDAQVKISVKVEGFDDDGV